MRVRVWVYECRSICVERVSCGWVWVVTEKSGEERVEHTHKCTRAHTQTRTYILEKELHIESIIEGASEREKRAAEMWVFWL